MQINADVCGRVAELKKKLRFYTTDEMASHFKISKTSLDHVLTKRRNPTQKMIDAFLFIGKVNRDWLLNGNGEIFQGKNPNIELDGDEEMNQDCIENMKRLTESQLILAKSNAKAIDALIGYLQSQNKEEKKE